MFSSMLITMKKSLADPADGDHAKWKRVCALHPKLSETLVNEALGTDTEISGDLPKGLAADKLKTMIVDNATFEEFKSDNTTFREYMMKLAALMSQHSAYSGGGIIHAKAHGAFQLVSFFVSPSP